MRISSFSCLLCSILALLALASCKKGIDGSYHFKMSGSFECGTGTMNRDSVYVINDTANFIISPVSGQLRIVHKDGDQYLVNMSAMLGGELMPFTGTIRNDSLFLDRQDVTLFVSKEGNSSSSSSILSSVGKTVRVTMSGSGRMYSNTIMLDMFCEGDFYYTENTRTYHCIILPETSSIICASYREEE